ncbi:hypothetical protein LMG33818_000903 [Halomonadaceae bacterium LMG 33818]|uniref:phage holin family protein n=1 Tax=Cernens ardua TaxID=3402176 RepID=UPI003EDC0490
METPPPNDSGWLVALLFNHLPALYNGAVSAISRAAWLITKAKEPWHTIIKDSLFVGFITIVVTPAINSALAALGYDTSYSGAVAIAIGLLGVGTIRATIVSYLNGPMDSAKTVVGAIKEWLDKRKQK